MAARQRTCIVTREASSPDELIRFVCSPDGLLMCDLAGKLPGRGAWVTAEPEKILEALRKGAFRHALKTAISAEGSALIASIKEQMAKRTLQSLHFCIKAGELISGFEKVASTMRNPKEKVAALIIASDASEGVVKDLPEMPDGAVVIRDFPREVLAPIVGKTNAVYIALKSGPASDNFLKEYARFTRFRDNDAL